MRFEIDINKIKAKNSFYRAAIKCLCTDVGEHLAIHSPSFKNKKEKEEAVKALFYLIKEHLEFHFYKE